MKEDNKILKQSLRDEDFFFKGKSGNLPSEVQNKIHPPEEQSDRADFLLKTSSTVTRRYTIQNSRYITNPLQIVTHILNICHSLRIRRNDKDSERQLNNHYT